MGGNANYKKLAVDLIKYPYGSILDIGCGNKELKKYLPSEVYYQGIDSARIDLEKRDDEIQNWELEKGIPYNDNFFDVVAGIAILEHLENCHFVFKEMIRVAKKEVIIGIPNMYHWPFRLRYLLGKSPLGSGASSLTPEPRKNRHRYNPTYDEIVEFAKTSNCPIRISHGFYHYKKLKFLTLLDRLLSNLFPRLFTYILIIHIDLGEKG